MRLRMLTAGLLASMAVTQAGAVNVVLDYSYDSYNFFGNATAKAAIEQAASDFSALLTDSMNALSPESDVVGSTSTYSFQYSLDFTNPGTGGPVSLVNEWIAEDEYRIYVGGRPMSGTTLGVGGSGGFGYNYGTSSGDGFYSQSEISEINSKIASFQAMVDGRFSTASDFRSWGGAVSFDTSGVTWHYDHTTAPVSGSSDFYSVALHEIAHAVGFGGNLWDGLVGGGVFNGANAYAVNGNSYPATDPGTGHWLEGTMSTVLTGGDPQEASLDPNLTNGTRKLLTDLDAAGLADIGWIINSAFSYANSGPPADLSGDGDVDDEDLGLFFSAFTGPDNGPSPNPSADLSGDGDVDDEDLGQAFSAFTGPLGPANVPEPASLALLGLGGLALARRRMR